MSDRVRLILADDHPVFREGLAAGLRHWPEIDVVAEAATGGRALDLVSQHEPDVVLVDMRMPDMNGLDVLRALRATGSELPVIILTADQDSQNVYSAIAEGAQGFLAKDLDRDAIARAVLSVARGGVALPPGAQVGLIAQVQSRSAADQVQLTERERQVLDLIATGRSAPAIGQELHLATATIKTHLQSLYEKLDVNDRAAAVACAMRKGLIR